MSQQGKNKKGRLSLNKSNKNQQPGTSIVDLFKRQKLQQNSERDLEIKAEFKSKDTDDDVVCIKETTSPYFTKKGKSKIASHSSKSKLKDKISKEPVVIQLDEDGSETVEAKTQAAFSPKEKEQNKVSEISCLVNSETISNEQASSCEISEADEQRTKRKGSDSVEGGANRKRLKLSKLSVKPIPQSETNTDHAEKNIVQPSPKKQNPAKSVINNSSNKLQTNQTSKNSESFRTDVLPNPVSRSKNPEEATEKEEKFEKVKNDSDDRTGDAEVQDVEGDEVVYRVPYYLENFLTILTSIRSDKDYSRLFNEEDFSVLTDFESLSDEGQKLYVRLFQRKLRWLRAGQIQYPKIAEDLNPFLQELVCKGLILDESRLDDLSEVLHTLPVPDLRGLAKSLRLQTTDVRPALIEAILKHARQKSIGSFFTAGKSQGNNEKSVLKRACSILGSCYKVDEARRWVFMRAMMLFSLHNITGDEDEMATNQLFQMLQTNIGQITYPSYTVCRETEIFGSRDEFLSFCSAVQLASDLREAVEGNNLAEALSLYEEAKPQAKRILGDTKITKQVKRLPEHLRWFTAGACCVRALTWGVEMLQKTRDYKAAVSQLQELLNQSIYHTDYRGRWYDRLALNLQTHLKQPEKALEAIKEGLNDPCMRVGHRLAIWQRAQKICTMPSLKKLHHNWDDFKDDYMAAVKESPKVTIQGRQMSIPGAQSTWCTDDSCTDGSGDVTFLRHVEDVALRYYANNGYPQGIHGEGGTLSVLLSLLFWEVFFTDVPDVFINPYQSAPLDLYTDHFYKSRKMLIDDRLQWLEKASIEEIEEELTRSWNEHENTFCIGLNWERFQDLNEMKGLARCIGGDRLSKIFSRLLKNLRFTRSGFPDLIVWNTETQQFKVSEVKGPGDRLSTKQILWLDYLNEIGVDAEVCYVTAVGAKKLR